MQLHENFIQKSSHIRNVWPNARWDRFVDDLVEEAVADVCGEVFQNGFPRTSLSGDLRKEFCIVATVEAFPEEPMNRRRPVVHRSDELAERNLFDEGPQCLVQAVLNLTGHYFQRLAPLDGLYDSLPASGFGKVDLFVLGQGSDNEW